MPRVAPSRLPPLEAAPTVRESLAADAPAEAQEEKYLDDPQAPVPTEAANAADSASEPGRGTLSEGARETKGEEDDAESDAAPDLKTTSNVARAAVRVRWSIKYGAQEDKFARKTRLMQQLSLVKPAGQLTEEELKEKWQYTDRMTGEKMVANPPRAFWSFSTCVFFCTFGWMRVGDYACEDRKGAHVAEHSNLSLISTLFFTVAISGMFLAPEFDPEVGHGRFIDMEDLEQLRARRLHIVYGYVWCWAAFCFLFSSISSVVMLMATNEINNEVQFDFFEKKMGPLAMRLPFIGTFIGFLFQLVGLVLHLVIIYGNDMAWCCISICSLFVIPFIYQASRAVAPERAFGEIAGPSSLPSAAAQVNQTAWSLAHVHCTDARLLYADFDDLVAFLKGDGNLGDLCEIPNAEVIAQKLSILDIDKHLLLLMSDDELAAIPTIAFGDVIRLKRLVAEMRSRSETVTPDGGILDNTKDGEVDIGLRAPCSSALGA